MAHSFGKVLTILNDPETFLFHYRDLPPPGELQYCGFHFSAAIHYAIKSASRQNDATFIDKLTALAELSAPTGFPSETSGKERFLSIIVSILTDIRGIFAVQQLQQYSPERVYIVASFIEFLVDALEKSSSPSCSWVIIPSQTDNLCKRLKFVNVFLKDAPLQCTELEGNKNVILEEIESIANEVGIFSYSFFFTEDQVTMTKMDLELSLLLSKLEVVEEKIREHCVTVTTFEQRKFTTPNLTSASTYIIDSLLHDLNILFNDKVDLDVQVKDQITTLQEDLYSCKSMLRDRELPRNKVLKECEMQLIDFADQVEYFIACLVAGEVPFWYLALKLPKFIRMGKPIRASLSKFKLNLGISGLRVAESSINEVSSSQVAVESIPMSDDIIVGFKEMRRQIASELIGGPNRLQIIALIGMGGLGKTTLARKLYNDSNIILRFDRRSWCIVSQTYQKSKLLMDIVSSVCALNKDEISKMEDHQLADRVYKSLKGNRYFLVVDDKWKKEVWDDLKRYFPDDRNGSRILFTSRNKDVVLQGLYEPIIHDLPLLSTHECWDLLQKKVFSDSICPQELQDVGKEIARNCKGLPLAVIGIAAVLANIGRRKNIWEEVAINLTSYVSKDQDILELSYWHLPSHLKPCFLYLGMFKEDEEIPVRQLLLLWVSQGFISKNEHKISEDVAEDYLLELINRSMVQVAKRRSDTGVKTITMHDLIRDMCLRLGNRENFFKTINEESSIYEQHNHICINSSSYDFTSRPVGLHIHSLFCDFREVSFFTSSMKRLRVLKLSGKTVLYNGTTFGFLIQLRHLECGANLVDFSSHKTLEVLIVRVTLKIQTQLNMPKLRYLCAGGSSPFVPLEKLDIPQDNSLQSISGISIVDFEDEERLRRLSQLRRLKCVYGERRGDISPDFSSLTQLVSVDIKNFDATLVAINLPIHIKKLSLRSMYLTCGSLLSIGRLPKLEILKLIDVHFHFEKTRWNTNDDEFKGLKFLKLESVTLEEWNTSEDHFPVLEHLVLRRCRDLKLVPSDLGNIPTLQRIEVLHCGEDVRNSVEYIKEEQEAYGNEQLKVIIFGAFKY